MSNIFALHYRLQKKLKSIYLTNYKYDQYLADNIIHSIVIYAYPLEIRHPCSVFLAQF